MRLAVLVHLDKGITAGPRAALIFTQVAVVVAQMLPVAMEAAQLAAQAAAEKHPPCLAEHMQAVAVAAAERVVRLGAAAGAKEATIIVSLVEPLILVEEAAVLGHGALAAI
jgi:hypothetical protein